MADHTDIVKQDFVVNIVPDYETFEQMITDGEVSDNELYYVGGEASGVTDHRQLTHKDASDQHPISAITGLSTALTEKQEALTAGSGISIENNVISATGSGGTADFDALTNRPSYNGSPMTHATDIPEVPIVPTTTNLLKGDGAGGIEAAVPGTDYVGETESVSELTIDTTVTEDSTNLVTSGAVFDAVTDLQPKTITDTAGHFTTDTVEGALAELGEAKLNPSSKTSAMTQAVGKDTDGTLWTTPGSGGGYPFITSTDTPIAEYTTEEDVGELAVTELTASDALTIVFDGTCDKSGIRVTANGTQIIFEYAGSLSGMSTVVLYKSIGNYWWLKYKLGNGATSDKRLSYSAENDINSLSLRSAYANNIIYAGSKMSVFSGVVYL